MDTTEGVPGVPQTICLTSHRIIQKARLTQSGAVFKAVELDHGHIISNATLKLEIGLKTQEWLPRVPYGSLAKVFS